MGRRARSSVGGEEQRVGVSYHFPGLWCTWIDVSSLFNLFVSGVSPTPIRDRLSFSSHVYPCLVPPSFLISFSFSPISPIGVTVFPSPLLLSSFLCYASSHLLRLSSHIFPSLPLFPHVHSSCVLCCVFIRCVDRLLLY